MKLKKSGKMLMCCMAVAGTLATNVLMAEALSSCTHPYFQVAMDVLKQERSDANYHFKLIGTHHVCPCGYEYWTDLYETKEKHVWDQYYDKGHWYTYCTICKYKP